MSLVLQQSVEHLADPLARRAQFCEFVFEKLIDWRQLGVRTALLTLVNVEGSSPRPVGSQMAVSEDGDFVGLISGGCLEVALVAEAQMCIDHGRTVCVRYGRDSDYFDIQLPCGSGVDILIQPLSSAGDDWIGAIYHLYRRREPVLWRYDFNSQLNTVSSSGIVEPLVIESQQYPRQLLEQYLTFFEKSFSPRYRIVVVGEGDIFEYFIQLVQFFDIDVIAYSNKLNNSLLDSNAMVEESSLDMQRYRISDFDANKLDRWTSLVVLSHEHSWEHSVLLQALGSDVDFISALGSKDTHAKRLRLLLDSGVDECRLKILKGPAGLDIGGRNPPEIALSILSEIIARKNGK